MTPPPPKTSPPSRSSSPMGVLSPEGTLSTPNPLLGRGGPADDENLNGDPARAILPTETAEATPVPWWIGLGWLTGMGAEGTGEWICIDGDDEDEGDDDLIRLRGNPSAVVEVGMEWGRSGESCPG